MRARARAFVCWKGRVSVCKSLPCVMESWKKKREAIICYAGLTLKQGISGKL